jgi:hypothetical protein
MSPREKSSTNITNTHLLNTTTPLLALKPSWSRTNGTVGRAANGDPMSFRARRSQRRKRNLRKGENRKDRSDRECKDLWRSDCKFNDQRNE